MRQATANITLKDTLTVRSPADTLDSRLNVGNKSQLQTGLTLRKILRCRLELDKSLRMKFIRNHLATERRTRSSASGPGMVLTLPERTSFSRRCASTVQSW